MALIDPTFDPSLTEGPLTGTILVVDDNDDARGASVDVLELEGFTTLNAGNGPTALGLVNEHCPDLVLLDVMMPGITGLELCRHLRTRGDTARTPVIMLSARADAEAVQRGIAAGANEYLSKTTPHTHIVSRVQALLDCNGRQVANLF